MEEVVGIRVSVGAMQVHEDEDGVVAGGSSSAHETLDRVNQGSGLLDGGDVGGRELDLEVLAVGVGAVISEGNTIGIAHGDHAHDGLVKKLAGLGAPGVEKPVQEALLDKVAGRLRGVNPTLHVDSGGAHPGGGLWLGNIPDVHGVSSLRRSDLGLADQGTLENPLAEGLEPGNRVRKELGHMEERGASREGEGEAVEAPGVGGHGRCGAPLVVDAVQTPDRENDITVLTAIDGHVNLGEKEEEEKKGKKGEKGKKVAANGFEKKNKKAD